MSTKPILFNTEMVKAILDGRKHVTRRVIKRDLLLCCDFDTDGTICGCHDKDGDWYEIEDFAPYKIDDTLYIRETWRHYKDGYMYKASCNEDWDGLWKPSIHMPKEAARIWLKVTNVRVERLQDMTVDDAHKEGIDIHTDSITDGEILNAHHDFSLERFETLWDSTIPKKDIELYGWFANPWVWVIEFERIEKGDI